MLVSLYMLVCIVRVFLSWIPGLAYSPFGRVISNLADPYLRIFRKLNPTARLGVDISPIIALAVLLLVENILSTIVMTGSFSITLILAQIINAAWTVVSSFLTFFIIIILIRFVAMLFNKNNGQIWQSIDQLLYPINQKIIPIFSKNKFLQPKYQLLILLVLAILVKLAIGFIIGVLIALIL